MPGMGSRYDAYIDQLVALAKVQRVPLENRLETTEVRLEIWQDMQRHLTQLQTSMRFLFGFESIFNERQTGSTHPDVITLAVRRGTDVGTMDAVVHQRAAADRFFSHELPLDHEVKAGRYTFLVGEEEVALEFVGGTLREFSSALNGVNDQLLRTGVVQSRLDAQTFFIEGLVTGEEFALGFEGRAREFAFETGLIGNRTPIVYRVESDTRNLRVRSEVDITAPLPIEPSRQLVVALESQMPVKIVSGSQLVMNYSTTTTPRPMVSYNTQETEDEERALDEGRLVRLDDNGALALPILRNRDTFFLRLDDGIAAVSPQMMSEGEGELIIDLTPYQGREIEAFILHNENSISTLNVDNIRLELASDVDFMPLNAASMAQDADFLLDGVRVTRSVNVIDDLIPGVTFSLHGESPTPVRLTIDHNMEEATNVIQNFIFDYNQTIAHINIATAGPGNTEVVEELRYLVGADRERAMNMLGKFQGDLQLVQLKNRLHTLMISAYPLINSAQSNMVFSEIGVATNMTVGTMASASQRRGYFEIDPKRMASALETRWEDVRTFFGRSVSRSGVLESGLVAGLDPLIREYIGLSGLIRNRTTSLDSEVTRQTKALDDFDKNLEVQRKQWQADFARAANAEREMQRMQDQLRGLDGSNNRRN